MSGFFVQILRQVDNLNCFKRTFLHQCKQKSSSYKPRLLLQDHINQLDYNSIAAPLNTLTQIPHPLHNSSDR